MNRGIHGLPQDSRAFWSNETPLIPGFWFAPTPYATGFTTGTVIGSTRHITPLRFSTRMVVDGWYVKIATAVASSTVTVALYRLASPSHIELVCRLGAVDSASTGDKQVTISPTIIEPGEYLALFDAGGANVAMTSYNLGRWGVRSTDPSVFAGFHVAGVILSGTGLPPILTWRESISGSSSQCAPIIVFKLREIL